MYIPYVIPLWYPFVFCRQFCLIDWFVEWTLTSCQAAAYTRFYHSILCVILSHKLIFHYLSSLCMFSAYFLRLFYISHSAFIFHTRLSLFTLDFPAFTPCFPAFAPLHASFPLSLGSPVLTAWYPYSPTAFVIFSISHFTEFYFNFVAFYLFYFESAWINSYVSSTC